MAHTPEGQDDDTHQQNNIPCVRCGIEATIQVALQLPSHEEQATVPKHHGLQMTSMFRNSDWLITGSIDFG